MKLVKHLLLPSLCLLMAAGCATPPAIVGKHKDAVIDFTSCSAPRYPAEAIKTDRWGTVALAYNIGVDGKVLESKVEKSSGHADLDEAARTAIGLCTFKPATQDGKPVQEWMKMQYVWTLK